MLNLKTNKVVHSQGIIWLGKSYGKYYNIKKPHQIVQQMKSNNKDEEIPTFEGQPDPSTQIKRMGYATIPDATVPQAMELTPPNQVKETTKKA